MKKTLSLIILITTLFICIGCDIEPSEFNHESKGWEIWASGIIDKAHINIDGSNRTFIIKFKNDTEIKVNRFHNFNDIKEQDEGSIYRWSGDIEDRYFYMWVPKNKEITNIPIFEVTSIIPINPVINNMTMPTSSIKYEWQNAKSKQPPFYQTVLVKFEDSIVITAYYERPCIWKSEIDKRKMSGGIALKNIVQWKLVDLK